MGHYFLDTQYLLALLKQFEIGSSGLQITGNTSRTENGTTESYRVKEKREREREGVVRGRHTIDRVRERERKSRLLLLGQRNL